MRRLVFVSAAAMLFTLAHAAPAAAATDVNGVLENLRGWVAGVLAGLATLFLTIGGGRDFVAAGEPRSLEGGQAADPAGPLGHWVPGPGPVFFRIPSRALGDRWGS